MKSRILSKFRVKRDLSRCTQCRTCVNECAFDANYYDALDDVIRSREMNCVGCQNCVVNCPSGALSIVELAASTKRNGRSVGK